MIFREAGRVVPVFLVTALALLLALYWTLPFLKPHAKAETQTVFGPKQYTLTTTTPQTVSTLVRTSAGPAHLHVMNGAPDGSARLTHATITLNGLETLSPQDLGLHVAVVDKPVTLLSTNVLAVTLSGPVNGTLEVTLERRAASLASVTPDSGRQGETLVVSVEGSNTHFVRGATQLWASPGISVGGAPPGELGPVIVEDPTHVTATLTISPTTVLGPRTLLAKTNGERAALLSGFTVLAGTSALSGTTVTTLAGSGSAGLEDGPGTTAEFRFPFDVAAHADGSAVVADTGNSKLRRVAPDGTVSTVSLPVTLLLPAGVTLDSSGRTVIADTGRCVIRIVNTDGSVTTIGKGSCGFADGPSGTARFKFPRDVAADATGNLYVADTGNFRVRRIDPQGNVTTLAGAGTFGGADGPAATATFGLLSGIAVASDATVFVSDAVFHKIRRIVPDGTVSTLAGTGTAGFADGAAATAQFAFPTGLTRDGAGNLYIADTLNSLLRRLTPQGAVETVAGTGARGEQDGPGTEATFTLPFGVGLAAALPSTVFLADTFNHKIRVVQMIAPPTIITLSPTTGAQGETLTLTVTGTNLSGATALTFLKGGAADLDITASGITVDAAGTTLTASVTIASGATRGSRVVTVTTPAGTSSSTGTSANTFTVLSRLILTPSLLTIAEGGAATLTVSIGNAAEAGGITVTLSSAGPSIATVTSPVTIAEGATSTMATVTGVTEGITNITATAAGFADAIAVVNVIASAPTISDFAPGAGKVGDTITISGTGFRLNAAANTVSFTGPNNTRITTPVTSATSTQLVVKVPAGAITGPLRVSTTGGAATSTGHFIVLPSQNFTITAAPATATAQPGGQASVLVSTTGQEGFTGLVNLGVSGLPSGVTGRFERPALAPGQSSGLLLEVGPTAQPGAFPLTISGSTSIEGTPVQRTATATLQILSPGQTSLAGRIVETDGLPVPGVTIRLGSLTTTTDAAGSFTLFNPPTGTQIVFLDGSTASTPQVSFPTIPVTVNIAAGRVNPLPFQPHFHRQKARNFADISNTGTTRNLTDSEVPGFALTVPAGVTITGWDGQSNTQISVQPIPSDRLPLPPLPEGGTVGNVYMFFFGKTGGGTPSAPIPITVPNNVGALPGETLDLFYFDDSTPTEAKTNTWQIGGTGTVTSDGRQIVTTAGGIRQFCCGGAAFRRSPPPPTTPPELAAPSRPPEGAGMAAGEPVDLSTGLFILEKADMVLPGRVPVALTRTYRTNDASAGPFGPGTSHPYEIFLQAQGADLLILFLPGNSRTFWARQTDGSFQNDQVPAFRGARITTELDGSRTLRWKDGSVWRFDTNGRLTARSDRNGNTVTITRDSQGRATAITEPGGRSLTLDYDGISLRVSSVTDPLGRTVRYSYDANGRLIRVRDPADGVTSYTYDAQNRLLTITDPRAITFLTNEYDANGRVVKQTQADAGVWAFAYTVSGGVVTQTIVTDPRGNSTTHRFNNFGYAIEQTDALGQSTKFERAFGTNLLLSTTDTLGRVTRFTYDPNGNVTSITDPAGNVRSFEYEPNFNRLAKITDPLGNITQFAYDTNGNLSRITDPLGNLTQIAYNQFGQPVSTTDPPGNLTQFQYDPVGNLTSISDPLGNSTQRTYDPVSRLIAQTDPRGKSTEFRYDDLNRISQIVDALLGVTAFTYDGNGNLLTVTDARGSVTAHTYDSMDRLATRTDPLGREESYQYDPNGNLTQFTDRKRQVSTFTYDPLNRRTQSQFGDGTSTKFTFDTAGRLIRATDSQTGTIVEEYDTLNRLIRESTPQGTISYAYDALGRRTTMTVDGQPPVGYTYDAASRLRSITQAPLNPVTIDYDALGRRTLLTLPNAVSTEYQYDIASRLTALIYRNAAGLLGDLTYEYDAAGNRVGVGGSFARTLLPDPVLSSTYDAANQQLAFADKAMTFDANGNLQTITDPIGPTTFTWDARNRLASLSGPALAASFTYDAFGRRTQKVINGQIAQYHYDGKNIIQELLNGVPVTYLRGLFVDEPFVRGAAESYIGDTLGSTVALADSSGALATTYTFEPFGRATTAGAISTNPFQYTGRENDGTGLYYYRTRYHAPQLARFIAEDALKILNETNLYLYVRNSPILLYDPLGLYGFPDAVQQITAGGDIVITLARFPKSQPQVIAALISLQADKIAATAAVIEGRPSAIDLITAGVGTGAAVVGGGFASVAISGFGFGYTVGTIFNKEVLSNPYLFANGNPVENLFCAAIFDCGPQPNKAVSATDLRDEKFGIVSLGGRK